MKFRTSCWFRFYAFFSLDFIDKMGFVMSCHVILLAKCFATFGTLMSFNSGMGDQMLIQLRCCFEL